MALRNGSLPRRCTRNTGRPKGRRARDIFSRPAAYPVFAKNAKKTKQGARRAERRWLATLASYCGQRARLQNDDSDPFSSFTGLRRWLYFENSTTHYTMHIVTHRHVNMRSNRLSWWLCGLVGGAMQPTCWYGVRRRWDSIIADKLTDTMLARGGDGSGVPQSLASRKNSGGVDERRRNRGWENRNTRMERVQWETLSGRSRHEWKREAGRGVWGAFDRQRPSSFGRSNRASFSRRDIFSTSSSGTKIFAAPN